MLVFLHANGYPFEVYLRFSQHLEQSTGQPVLAPPNLSEGLEGFTPKQHWWTMVERVEAWLRQCRPTAGDSEVCLVGHSMGGYLAVIVAARLLADPRRPKLKLVLVDAPITRGWRTQIFNLGLATGLNYKAGPAPIAVRRRDTWESKRAAQEFFARKGFIQRWEKGVLEDFIEHGVLENHQGAATLRIPKITEAHIYANLPVTQGWTSLMQLKKTDIPVHMLAGDHSEEMRMAGWRVNERAFAKRFHRMALGHLMPFEAPKACAEKIAEIMALEAPR